MALARDECPDPSPDTPYMMRICRPVLAVEPCDHAVMQEVAAQYTKAL